MASPSPPKPWERRGVTGASSSLSSGSSMAATAPAPAPAVQSAGDPTSSTASRSLVSTSSQPSSSQPPPLPRRSRPLNTVVNRTAANYGPYSASRYGTSAYGPYGSYTSPYSRFGGSMYSGMSTYGNLYGGLNYGMGPYGGYQGNPNDPNSLTNTLGQSTQATFQIIESIVGAFANFAQMLESTYMATHSSFFAMVSVAEQFGNLRNTLGSILGIFALLRWLRSFFGRITGRSYSSGSANPGELTLSDFASFESRRGMSSGNGGASQPRPSKKPLLVFILAVFGLPYLMGKLIRAIARAQGRAAGMIGDETASGSTSPLLDPQSSQTKQMDPTKFEFCRVLYDFNPETVSNGQASASMDLAVKKGDLVAVLSKSDPMGNPSEWWRCRTRDGRTGYLPSPYLETIQMKAGTSSTTSGDTVGGAGSGNDAVKAITSGSGVSTPASRAGGGGDRVGAAASSSEGNTSTGQSSQPLTATDNKSSTTQPNPLPTSTSTSTSTSVPAGSVPALPSIRAGDISVNSFQKSQFFYS